MKRTVRLTERELKRMISESVRRILKEQVDSSLNNSKNIAYDIIKMYFGGYIPQKLSDEGMECHSDKELYDLIANMENYYVNQQDTMEYDESEIDAIHNEVTNWVMSHNR